MLQYVNGWQIKRKIWINEPRNLKGVSQQGTRGHCVVWVWTLSESYASNQLNTYGRLWIGAFDSVVQHHHWNTKWGNNFWKNDGGPTPHGDTWHLVFLEFDTHMYMIGLLYTLNIYIYYTSPDHRNLQSTILAWQTKKLIALHYCAKQY